MAHLRYTVINIKSQEQDVKVSSDAEKAVIEYVKTRFTTDHSSDKDEQQARTKKTNKLNVVTSEVQKKISSDDKKVVGRVGVRVAANCDWLVTPL